jgi:hypothetical protein
MGIEKHLAAGRELVLDRLALPIDSRPVWAKLVVGDIT